MSFEPNPYWSSTYVGTDEIQQYFLRFTEKYDLRKYCQFNKRVSHAEWDNVKGQWNIQVTDLKTGNSVYDWCHFLINAQGVLNNWKWPDIPGIDKFEGKILHTAKYDRSLDLTDKTVALLGTGYVNENKFFHQLTHLNQVHQQFKHFLLSSPRSKASSPSIALHHGSCRPRDLLNISIPTKKNKPLPLTQRNLNNTVVNWILA